MILLKVYANKMLLSCYLLWENIYGAHWVKGITVGRQQGSVPRVTVMFVCPVSHISNSGHPQDALSLGEVSTAISYPLPPRHKQFWSLPRAPGKTQSLPGVMRTSGASCGKTVLPVFPAEPWPTACSLHHSSNPHTSQASSEHDSTVICQTEVPL